MFKLLPKDPAYVKAVNKKKKMPDHDSCIHSTILLKYWSKIPEKKNKIKASLIVLWIKTLFGGKRNDFYAYYSGEKMSTIFGFRRDCPQLLASCREHCP